MYSRTQDALLETVWDPGAAVRGLAGWLGGSRGARKQGCNTRPTLLIGFKSNSGPLQERDCQANALVQKGR